MSGRVGSTGRLIIAFALFAYGVSALRTPAADLAAAFAPGPLAARVLGTILPTACITAGLSLLIWPARRLPLVAAMSVVLLLTADAVFALTTGGTDAAVRLAQYAFLMILGGLGLTRYGPTGSAGTHTQRDGSPIRDDEPRGRHLGGSRSGFTLIELLVVVVIMVILIAIALPGLGGARERAREAGRLATLRSLGQATAQYTADHDARLPYFTSEEPTAATVPAVHAASRGTYFTGHGWFWASALVPEYFPNRTEIEPESRDTQLLRMHGPPERVVLSTYTLTHTAFAAPRFWSDGPLPEPLDRTLLHGVSLTAAVFPSEKGLIAHGIAGPGGSRLSATGRPIAFVDGRAATISLDELAAVPVVERPLGAVPFAVMSTVDGIAGRDVPGP